MLFLMKSMKFEYINVLTFSNQKPDLEAGYESYSLRVRCVSSMLSLGFLLAPFSEQVI